MNSVLSSKLSKKLFGTDYRTSLLRKNILFSFLIKGWSGLVYFLIVPVTLNCLGEYNNGIWLTISAMLIWIDNMDIGLGNGLRNKLTEYIAHGDEEKSRVMVSNTFIMLICIIIPTFFLLLAIIHWGDIYHWLSIDPSISGNVKNVLAVALLFVCSTFILKFISNIYLGMQLPAVSNLLVAISYTLALWGTYILYWTSKGSLLNIAIVNTSSPLITYLAMYPFTFGYKYPYLRPRISDFNWSTAKSLFNIGIKFFLLQMTSSLMFLASSIYMSRIFSPSMVTPYQITYRYFSIVLHIFTVICSPYWSATTDAYARGDIEWIKTSSKKLMKVVLMSYCILLVMVLFSDFVYSIWIGDQTSIPWSFTIGMAVYIAIIHYCLVYCYFLNGMGALNVQLICTVGGTVLFLILAPIMTHLHPAGYMIIIALCIANLPSFFCNKIQFIKIINNKAYGLWKS